MNTQVGIAVISIAPNATRSGKPRLEFSLEPTETLGDFFMTDKAMRMNATSRSPQDKKFPSQKFPNATESGGQST